MALYARERDRARAAGRRLDAGVPGRHAADGRRTVRAARSKLGRRAGARLGRTREIWRASDGFVSFGLRGGAARAKNLAATVEYMHECGMAPDWLRRDGLARVPPGQARRRGHRAARGRLFGAFFAARTMRELYEEALARRILLAPCNDAGEILAHPQLRDRDLFTTIDYPGLGSRARAPGLLRQDRAATTSMCAAGRRSHRRAQRRGLRRARRSTPGSWPYLARRGTRMSARSLRRVACPRVRSRRGGTGGDALLRGAGARA